MSERRSYTHTYQTHKMDIFTVVARISGLSASMATYLLAKTNKSTYPIIKVRERVKHSFDLFYGTSICNTNAIFVHTPLLTYEGGDGPRAAEAPHRRELGPLCY